MKAESLADTEKQFLAARALQEDFVPARIGLAKVYRLRGPLSEAVAQSSAVLLGVPQEASALLERGRAEYDAGDKEAARRDFEN